MAVMSKPIPALYIVYILRSKTRHASVYIGSTPHPPRRLKEHNGQKLGGAKRTNKTNLRPWEMVAIVSGFPGLVAALQFEWALQNPHISLRIDPSERISKSTACKRNGAPRRPIHSIATVLPNLHLLLRVPGFARWPLKLHFFDEGVYGKWKAWCAEAPEPLRATLPIATDFKPTENKIGADDDDVMDEDGEVEEQPWGVHALPLDYAPMKGYVEKSKSVFELEEEGDCVVCGDAIDSGKGLHVMCSNDDCEGVGHLKCWSTHICKLDQDAEAILPMVGECPKCKGSVRWGDMMKELTLRIRGQEEVAKMLKKRVAKAKTKAKTKANDST